MKTTPPGVTLYQGQSIHQPRNVLPATAGLPPTPGKGVTLPSVKNESVSLKRRKPVGQRILQEWRDAMLITNIENPEIERRPRPASKHRKVKEKKARSSRRQRKDSKTRERPRSPHPVPPHVRPYYKI